MANDLRLERIARALALRTPVEVVRDDGAREAAVALVLRPERELELLLIRRAEHDADPWSGHMALPGGRREPGDADLLATAMRETEEETGVPLGRVGESLGRLDEVGTRGTRLPRLVIAPYVVTVPAGTPVTAHSPEVDIALWAPLSALRDEAAMDELIVELDDGPRAFESLRYGEHVIWGLTHRVLTGFFGLLAEAKG